MIRLNLSEAPVSNEGRCKGKPTRKLRIRPRRKFCKKLGSGRGGVAKEWKKLHSRVEQTLNFVGRIART